MDRHDDEDDYLPEPKKSGSGSMLILGIVLGAGVLVVLLIAVCGGAFFFARLGPAQPQPARQEVPAVDGPAAKPAPAKDREPDGMKEKQSRE